MSSFIRCYAEFRYAECRYAECRYAECRYAECRYAECHVVFIVTLIFEMQNAIMLSVDMLSVV